MSRKKKAIAEELRASCGDGDLSLSRLAKASGIDSRTLRGYIHAGKLAASQGPSGGFRIAVDAAAAFFVGEGQALWDAAEGRRKEGKVQEVVYTEAELAAEVWRKPYTEFFDPSVWLQVQIVEASSLGRTRTAVDRRGSPKGSLLKPRVGANGYAAISISLEPSDAEKLAAKVAGKRPNYKPKNLSVHRLVAAAFLPNPAKLPQVGHKDNNRLNNRVENLEWTSAKANIAHALKTGGIGRSGGRPGAKLTAELAKFVKYSGERPSDVKRWLKEKHGIDYSLSKIHKLRRGEIWPNI